MQLKGVRLHTDNDIIDILAQDESGNPVIIAIYGEEKAKNIWFEKYLTI